MSLRIDGISKRFGGFSVLDNITLEVGLGDLVGLIGPNGAGKSTLFSVISGFIQADEGTIFLNDHLLNPLPPSSRARLGIVRTFQVPREFISLTVRDNLLVSIPNQLGENLVNAFFRPRAVKSQQTKISSKVDRVIDFLNLKSVTSILASQLSGGQKKLLEIGRAFLAEPSFILLDEPFAGVNPVLIDEIINHIRNIHAKGIGMIVVEHNLGALCRLADRLYVMDRGRIIAYGSSKDILLDQAVREAYLGKRS
jgi:branched-chain amino acid transport system ATP-binding protein